MHLVQLLLPLSGEDGTRFGHDVFARVRRELTERFGGVTAFQSAPAQGLWKDEGGEISRDEVVLFEVMVDALDRAEWARYREELRRRFGQQELVVRALPFERL